MTPAEYVEKCLVRMRSNLSLPSASVSLHSVANQMIFTTDNQVSTALEKSFFRKKFNDIKTPRFYNLGCHEIR